MEVAFASGEADSGANFDFLGRLSRLKPEFVVGLGQVKGVVGLVDLEGSAEFAGTVEEVFVFLGFGPSFAHRLVAFEGDGGANEDRASGARLQARDAEHPVVAVGEIGVRESGSVKHHPGPWGNASVCVAAGVCGTVGFGLYDSDSETGHDDMLAKQGFGGMEEFGVGGVFHV